MKTNLSPKAALLAVALTAMTLTTTTNAQSRLAADDGIAASPKLRQMLTVRKPSPRPAVATAPAMACSKCADLLTTELNPQAKGGQFLAGTATRKVAKHTCNACGSKLTVVGEGKARQTVATHKCSAEVPNPETCCASR